MEKFTSDALPAMTPPTMGMSVSHTSFVYRFPKNRDRSRTEHAGSAALTTCMNDTDARLYDAHADTCAMRCMMDGKTSAFIFSFVNPPSGGLKTLRRHMISMNTAPTAI